MLMLFKVRTIAGAFNSASHSHCFSIRADIALVLSAIARHNSSSVRCKLRTATLTHYVIRRTFCGAGAKNSLMAHRASADYANTPADHAAEQTNGALMGSSNGRT